MTAAHVRGRQVSAVKQLLAGKPEGHSRTELQTLLGRRADPKQLTATLNTMKSNGVIRATRTRGSLHFVLATENLLQPAVRTRVQRLTPAQADSARIRAATQGMAAAIPPSAASTTNAETVEQWMARTGKRPQVLPHNFDKPHATFPGRRPSINHKRPAA